MNKRYLKLMLTIETTAISRTRLNTPITRLERSELTGLLKHFSSHVIMAPAQVTG